MMGANPNRELRTTLLSWIIVVALALLFFCWGLFIYFAVGDKGPPPWHYGVVEDIPGQSPYATERDLSADPHRQHVAD
jgi:hypothetical protein